MTPRDTRTGGVLEEMILPALTRGGYACRYLARSQIAMPLKEAAARYGPCSVCKPPVPRGDEQAAPAKPSGTPVR